MAKKKLKKKLERGQVKTIDVVKAKCIECKTEYEATKTTYENGDIVISPQRCEPCQITHLTNGRVNTTIKKIQLLGNLKNRLGKEQRDAVITAITAEVEVLMDRYAGTATSASKFDLKSVSA